MASDARIFHTVTCTMTSDAHGTEDYDRVEALASKLESDARRRGFSVMYEDVDEAE